MYLETEGYDTHISEVPTKDGGKKRTSVVELPVKGGKGMDMFVVSEEVYPKATDDNPYPNPTKECYISVHNPLQPEGLSTIEKLRATKSEY